MPTSVSSLPIFVPVAFALPQEPKAPVTGPPDPTGAPQQPGAGTTAPQQPPSQSPCMDSSTIWMLLPFLLLMWLLVLRPEQKRRKEQMALLSSLKVNDHVVTNGGLHGEVVGLTERTVTLRVDTVKMTFDRSAVARIERDEPPAAAGKNDKKS